MISTRSLRVTGLGEAAQVHQRIALTGDTLVELDDHVGHGGPLPPHRDHGVRDIIEIVHILLPERMTNSLFGEEAPAPGLRAEVHQSGVRTVHGYPERDGDVTLELGGVVRDEVGKRWVRDEGGDPAEEPGSLEQLFAERSGRAVANGDERQPGAGMAGNHAREQRQVVLDDGRARSVSM